jgi:hypothetical protein
MLLELIEPGSFDLKLTSIKNIPMAFIYYSFVTITTTGFGDITPKTDLASAFTILEAVIGQLYLVVLISWLVGMHIAKKSKQPKPLK